MSVGLFIDSQVVVSSAVLCVCWSVYRQSSRRLRLRFGLRRFTIAEKLLVAMATWLLSP